MQTKKPVFIHCTRRVLFWNRGKDHLYFQENSENLQGDLFEPQYHHLAEQNDSLDGTAPKQQGLLPGRSDHEAQVRLAGRSPDPVHVLDWRNPATKDLLSGQPLGSSDDCKCYFKTADLLKGIRMCWVLFPKGITGSQEFVFWLIFVFDANISLLVFFSPSALLDKGNKLRNAMVASTIRSSPDHVLELSEAHPPLKRSVSQPVRK